MTRGHGESTGGEAMCLNRLRVRAMLGLTAVLALLAVSIVGASAYTIYRSKNHLVRGVQEESATRAECAARKILEIAQEQHAPSLRQIVRHPEIKAQLDAISSDDCIVMTTITDENGEVLYQQYCPLTFPEGITCNKPNKIAATAPGIVQTSWDLNNAEMPRGVKPVSLPIRQGASELGTLTIGLSDVLSFSRADDLGEIISTSLVVLLAVVFTLVALTLGLLFTSFSRILFLQQRTAQSQHLAAIGAIARGLAHEIRNPLHSMALRLDCVREDLAEEEGPLDRQVAVSALDGVHRQLSGLEKIVGGFMAYANPGTLEREKISAQQLCSESLGDMESVLADARIRQEVDVPAGLELNADPSALRLVLRNLLTNAVAALADSPAKTIRLSASQGRKGVTIVVEDSGPGIPDEVVRCQGQGIVTRPCGGMGFGLATSRRLVEEHGGRLTLGKSKELGGARVVIELPGQ